ncbi:MAG: BglG family transcription antiterminator LicT [Erysipelotrichaceae bacterium]
MVVDKVINNNLVRSLNEKGQEVLLMGCGLGFKQKAGDLVDLSKVEKMYTMSDVEGTHQLEEILSKVSLECIQVVNEIVDYAKISLGSELGNNIYLTLCDHISFSLERTRKGIEIRNALLEEIKQFYYSEYMVGKEALDMIEKNFKLRLPEDEAGFIALHLVNANFNSLGIGQTEEMMKIIQNIVNIVRYHFNVELNEKTIHYDRFITHLKFFAMRTFSGVVMDEGDESFFLMIKNQYKKAYACVLKVADYMAKTYNIQLTNDEMMYLTVHIHRITTM